MNKTRLFISGIVSLVAIGIPAITLAATAKININGTTQSFSDIGSYTSVFISQYAIPVGIIAAFIMISFAGYTYIISGGNPEEIKLAKELIVGAVLGLLTIVLIGWILVMVLPENYQEIPSNTTTGSGVVITTKLGSGINTIKGEKIGETPK